MDQLESQIAKIQLSNSKSAKTYVYTVAEKASGSDAELFIVAELPLLDPSAYESCEKICLAITSSFRRAFQRPINDNSFETAISQINEELGKLTSTGQTYWVGKLNCIIGLKYNNLFSIATSGKVAAYLFRGGEFTDISCSSPKGHPLKTFESFSTGKIRLDDVIILSTTQLFNFISLDRAKTILENENFLTATQTIIHLLKDNTLSGISFASIFNLQVPAGETSDQEVINLENYVIETPALPKRILSKLTALAKTVFALDKSTRTPQTQLPKISLFKRIKNFGGGARGALAGSHKILGSFRQTFNSGKDRLNLQNFKTFTPQKKFFFIAALLLLVAFAINLGVTLHFKKIKQVQAKYTGQIKDSQKLIADAESSLLYKDEAGAKNFLQKAESTLPDINKLDKPNTDLYSRVFLDLQKVTQEMEKIIQVHATDISALSQAENLIKLPGILGVQTNSQIISYDLTNGKVEDNRLKIQGKIIRSVALSGAVAVIYNGESLKIWNWQDGSTGAAFTQNVPGKDNTVGLAIYSTNNRVYLLDKKLGKIFSFTTAGNKQIAKPTVAAISQNDDFSKALDLAIDGSIYVLFENGISKYHNGQKTAFGSPALLEPIGHKGKIYTQSDFKYLYILDSLNNRVVVLNKQGGIVETLVNPELNKPSDFAVDEKNKTIYVLNNGSLIKLDMP